MLAYLELNSFISRKTWIWMYSLMKSLRSIVLSLLPQRLRFALRYMAIHRKPSLLINPKKFNEKMTLRLALDRRPLHVILADKVRVRDYISERVGTQNLSNVLWVGANPGSLPFDSLPNRFVIKSNHASGFVKLIEDKNKIDQKSIVEELQRWLAFDYGEYSREWAYSEIERKIIVEEWIDSLYLSQEGIPWDFRFFMFDGKCAVIQVDNGTVKTRVRSFFTPEWDLLPFTLKYPPPNKQPEKPSSLMHMLSIAEAVSQGIDFVRVDIYDSDPSPIIGEMTMHPGGATQHFLPDYYDEWLGSFWSIKLND